MFIDKEILVLIGALILLAIIGYLKAQIIKKEIRMEQNNVDMRRAIANARRKQVLNDSVEQWRPNE
jgi:hypothetical protein